MRDEPETADGARSAPGPSGADRPGHAQNAEDDWFSGLERPAGYRGHSQGSDDDAGRRELTHQSDPYDYGADHGPSPAVPGQRPDRGHRLFERELEEEPITLDRELLARELAADRARQAASQPTSEVPRTPPSWPGPDETRISASREPARPADPFAQADPFGAATGPVAAIPPGPGRRSDGELAMAPFTAPPASASPAPRFEQALDAAYRWRTVLGLGLAGLVTLGVVVAYRPTSDDGPSPTESAAGGDESAMDAVTDLIPGTAESATVDPGSGTGEQEVGSSVDGRTTTTAGGSTSAVPSTGSSPTTEDEPATATTPTTQPGTASTPAPTDPDPTSSTTPASTTSSTVAAEPAVRQTEGGTLTAPAVVRSQHEGFTGSGYVGELITTGAAVSVKVESISNGTIGYTIRYASPPSGPAGDRTLTLSVNGTKVGQVVFPDSGGPTTWATVSGTVSLVKGPVDLKLSVEAGDTGWVNVDYLSLP